MVEGIPCVGLREGLYLLVAALVDGGEKDHPAQGREVVEEQGLLLVSFSIPFRIFDMSNIMICSI